MAFWRIGEKYRDIFHLVSFREFWLGFTFSAVGDAMTRVALIWFVYQFTHSPQAVGWLLLCYTGPVVLGGFFAGSLLDRFDRRMVMLFDNVIRGSAIALIPLLSFLGYLTLWHLYLVAIVYGFLMMISLAGGPAIFPSLVSEQQLATANALETLSYTLSGVFGPLLAGILIARFGAPSVLIIDTLSYALFALALARIRFLVSPVRSEQQGAKSYRLQDAVSLLLKNSVLLSTTLMFMTFNIGEGILSVWLPLFADGVLRGGPELYGLLLGVMAGGEVIGSILAGSLIFSLPLGLLICLAQMLSGISLSLVWLGSTLWWTIIGLALLGLFSAPLTIWAQTLRMQIIPEQLRGRSFALLRTLMQSTGPMASGAAGTLLPIMGIPVMIGVSAILVGVPGLFGSGIKSLRLKSDD
ncbi:MAG TPA: MFS transporter [Ktedonobacteraceae bacterium]|nr:MFS transporter [Ktedonobacteraceae bacterium]